MFDNLAIPIFPTSPDCIHIFNPPENYDPQGNWVHRYMSWPRTYIEWNELFVSLRKPLFEGNQVQIMTLPTPTYNEGDIPDVLFHREIAAYQLEVYFLRNQALRWQMKRLLMAYRRRLMDRRVIGEVDVGTMEPIPTNMLVSVYDWNSKAKYQFHADTIHRQIVGALKYQSLAISLPAEPKNPYTNLAWNVGQLWVLFDQIHQRLWHTQHKFMDPSIQALFYSKLNMDRFKIIYGPTLDVDCARRFFRDVNADYWELLYREGLDDMFTFLHPEKPAVLTNLLVDRSFSADLLREWDDMVFAFWCYDNLSRLVLPTVCSIYEMVAKARILLEKTEEILQKRKTITLAKRRRPARNGERDSE